jgi:HEAT repeat protein
VIVQLFLIPLLIVGIIVLVWLSFSWLAQAGTRPHELVEGIERLNHASWQQALTLANQLRDPRSAELREDRALAERLASLLARQIEEGSREPDRISLRMYLCRALGQFDLDVGLDVLAEAATTERFVEEIEVRRSALQAVAMLADRLGTSVILQHAGVLPALVAASDELADNSDEARLRNRLRSTAAFALGLVDDPRCRDRLAAMLHDPHFDVRCNAAVGLARQGDSRAVGPLVQIFDLPDDAIELADEERDDEHARRWKRDLVIANAVRAAGQFAGVAQEADLGALAQAVRRTAENKRLGRNVRIEALEVLRVIQQRSGATGAT